MFTTALYESAGDRLFAGEGQPARVVVIDVETTV